MNYELVGDVAVLHFDDGKANAVSHVFIDEMNEGLDKAEAEAKAVLILGKPGLLSGGFDLKEFEKGADNMKDLVVRGIQMFIRLYDFPQPVVIGCTGHAVAAGAFLLLAADNRIGVSGDFKICLPETAINMTIPRPLNVLCRDRLSPRHLTRAAIQAEQYDSQGAVEAGFLDELVEADALRERALALATQLAELPGRHYMENKRNIREAGLAEMRAELEPFIAGGNLR